MLNSSESCEISHCCTVCQIMVDAVLEVMQKAVVPWSSMVEKLVQQYLEMDGPKYVCVLLTLKRLPAYININKNSCFMIFLVLDWSSRQELLKESYQLMEIKKLLSGYGIRNCNPSNNAKIMVNLIWSVTRRLVVLTPTCTLSDRFVSFPDTDQIHPEARPCNISRGRPETSWGIQTSNLSDHLLVSHPADWPRQGMITNAEMWNHQSVVFCRFLCILGMLGHVLWCLQTEECITALKRLSTAEAECVVEHLTTWARLAMEDKDHISDEVGAGKSSFVSCRFWIKSESDMSCFKML